MSDELFFADVCVCCGSSVPEGEIICSECKKEISNQKESIHINYIKS